MAVDGRCCGPVSTTRVSRNSGRTRASPTALSTEDRDRLADYLAGGDADLREICALLGSAEAGTYCAALIADLHAQARDRITTDPELPAAVRTALAATWGYMTALYDPASPTSRLYLQARPDLQPAA
jgi:hypothetical protein